jgi:hypothetical protein
MLTNTEKLEEIANGICGFHGLWNSCENFDHTNTGVLLPSEVEKFLKDLYKYNYQSFNNRYKENEKPIYNNNNKKANKYQTLKSLQCLKYNIEIEYIDNAEKLNCKKRLEELDVLIKDIMYKIIEAAEEYQRAEWE